MGFMFRLTVVRARRIRSPGLPRVTWITGLLLGLSFPVLAQVPGLPNPQQPSPPAEQAADPLGRDTPRGTILGFNLAVRRDDVVSAAQYLQLTAAQRRNVDTLARQLNELIDRYFAQPIAALSSSRSGAANDGLPLDRERVELVIEGEPSDLVLVRVNDPKAGAVWLIASETLARVPELYRSAQAPWLERIMPDALVNSTLFGISIALWLAYAATIAIPFFGLWFLSIASIAVARKTIVDPTRRRFLESWYAGLRWLLIFVLTLGIHVTLMLYLGFSLRFRFVYSRFAIVAAVVAGSWLLWRFLELSFAQARLLAQRRGESGFSSLLMLIERVSKVVITLVAIFAILTIAGVDTTTALAGIGIGGVAVALGAQKSVENLIGGVFLITDKALAVGDWCRIADRQGSIEDITLRSVRLRTLEQTLLSIPAGALSQANIENFTTRGKILVQTTLRLRYETTVEQLRSILENIRRLLSDHPQIEADSSRIRLVDFGAQAVELELFAYVLTSDFLKFLAVREDLLLQIAEIVETAGSGFARPTEFLYVGDQTAAAGRSGERQALADRQVARPSPDASVDDTTGSTRARQRTG
jgi:MscS family membrane protein